MRPCCNIRYGGGVQLYCSIWVWSVGVRLYCSIWAWSVGVRPYCSSWVWSVGVRPYCSSWVRSVGGRPYCSIWVWSVGVRSYCSIWVWSIRVRPYCSIWVWSVRVQPYCSIWVWSVGVRPYCSIRYDEAACGHIAVFGYDLLVYEYCLSCDYWHELTRILCYKSFVKCGHIHIVADLVTCGHEEFWCKEYCSRYGMWHAVAWLVL